MSDDLDDLHDIYNHPELIKYISPGKPLLLEQTKAAINSIVKNWQKYYFGVWAVIHEKHQKLIGHCGFKFLENTLEVQIGYLLLPSYWGRGLGTEAASAALNYGFEVAKLERIVAIAKPENRASRRVMEKMGMKYEKDAYYYNNHVVYYSISREAYQYCTQSFNCTTKAVDTPRLGRYLSTAALSHNGCLSNSARTPVALCTPDEKAEVSESRKNPKRTKLAQEPSTKCRLALGGWHKPSSSNI